MALDTYASLQASVGDFLNRSDLLATVPDFIRLAEAQLNRTIRAADMVTATTLTINSASTPLPSDFNGVISFELPTGSGNPLRYEKPEGVRALKQTLYSSPGTPIAWTMVGTNIETAPPPASAFVCPLVYYARIPPLTSGAPTNWLLTKHPDAYLYGALLQTAPYLKDDPRLAVWGQLYEKAISDINGNDARVSFGHALIAQQRMWPASFSSAISYWPCASTVPVYIEETTVTNRPRCLRTLRESVQ